MTIFMDGRIATTHVTKYIDVEIDKTRFNTTLDNYIGSIDENGIYQIPESFDIKFFGVTKLGSSALQREFAYKNIKSVSFPDLKIIEGTYALREAFYYCTSLELIEFPELEEINGGYCFYDWLSYTSSMPKTLSFPKLKSITQLSSSRYPMYYLAPSSSGVESVSFPVLESIIGSSIFYNSFTNNTNLTRMDFPNLKTISQQDGFGSSSTSYAFRGCSSLTEIHFRMDMQEIVSTLTGYADKWGATNATIYFDL